MDSKKNKHVKWFLLSARRKNPSCLSVMYRIPSFSNLLLGCVASVASSCLLNRISFPCYFFPLSRTINLFDRYVEWCTNKIFEIKTLLMSQTSEIPFAYFFLFFHSLAAVIFFSRMETFICLSHIYDEIVFFLYSVRYLFHKYTFLLKCVCPCLCLGVGVYAILYYFFMFLLFHRFASSLMFVYRVTWIDQQAKKQFS